jgi:WD40 repeat protein
MTASIEDQTVRLWDYTTNTCELKHDFSTLFMKSIALHPSGYFSAVAFDEHIKIFHILYQDLEEFYTFPIKKTSFLKYSRGG